MKNRVSAWIILTVITVVAGFGLALTNQITKEPISQQANATEERARKLVMPEAETFNELELADGNILFIAKKSDEIIGYIGKAVAKGYGGKIEVITGVSTDGTITGINVGGTDFAETPGLGAKAKDAAFTAQFAGKKSPVRRGSADQDNAVDGITAATITTNAVLDCVNSVARQVKSYLNPEADKPVQAAEGTSYAGEAVGFKGESNPVYVVVTVKDDGTITALKIGDERFAESDGFGAAALDPEFAKQFVGKSMPVAMEDIDAISGSTITTRAVLNAINSAYENKNVIVIAADKPEGTTYAGESVGFKGANNPIYVEVTVKDDGTITALKIGDERFAESDGFGKAALDPEFARQFVGKSMPVAIEDVDAISGSTITTKAVLDAINSAYANKNIIAEGISAPAPTAVVTEPTEELPEPEPVVVPENALCGSAKGYEGPVTVTAAFDEDGRITFILIGDEQFAETEGVGTRVLDPDFEKRFIGKLPPLDLADGNHPVDECHIDGLTGATVTTKAVLEVVNSLHAQAFPQEEPDQQEADAALVTEAPMTEAPVTKAPVTISENEFVVTKQGFMGPVNVRVSFNSDGRIIKVVIDSQEFKETPGYGALALEESYLSQFVDKQPPLSLYPEDGGELVENLRHVDTATSATSTAQAIVDAINEAYDLYTQRGHVVVTKQGFMGPVTVQTVFNEDGSIQSITVLPEDFVESPGYGSLALDEGFSARFEGKIPPLQLRMPGETDAPNLVNNLVNPDTSSAATATMKAILDAINEAFEIRH
jgi:electron transport complex protein RnfG